MNVIIEIEDIHPTTQLPMTCYHEAGHAVAAFALNIPFQKICIYSSQHGEVTRQDLKFSFTRAIASYHAGPLAENRFALEAGTQNLIHQWRGNSDDKANIDRIVEEAEKAGRNSRLIKKRAFNLAERLLTKHWGAVVSISQELIAQCHLKGGIGEMDYDLALKIFESSN